MLNEINLGILSISVLILIIVVYGFLKIKKVFESIKTEKDESVKLNQELFEKINVLNQVLSDNKDKILELKEGNYNNTRNIENISSKISDEFYKMGTLTEHIKKIAEESVGLNDILANRQARGALSEVLMESIIKSNLSSDQYEFQKSLSNGSRVDCALYLDKERNKILSVDSKFPLDSYIKYTEKNDSIAVFKRDIKKHINDIAEKYIIDGETEEWAMMFIPSEVIYLFVNEECKDLVSYSYENKVIITSPNVMLATAVSVKSVIKDQYISKEAKKIKEEVSLLIKEVERLNDRSEKLVSSKKKMDAEIDSILITTNKIKSKMEKITNIKVDQENK